MVSRGTIGQIIIQIIRWIRTKVVAGLQQTSYLMDKCPRRIAAMLALAIAEIAYPLFLLAHFSTVIAGHT